MKIRDEINSFLDKRDQKGIETYGETLDDCKDNSYDWNVMMLEESMDGWQYAVKENIRLVKILREVAYVVEHGLIEDEKTFSDALLRSIDNKPGGIMPGEED